MQRPSRNLALAVVITLAILVGAAIFVEARLAPAEARMLPEADGIIYVNLEPLRLASHFDRTSIAHSPAYQQFIDATGIVPERDLDRAAFALTRMADPHGPNGPAAFTEVFRGRFDPTRLEGFLARQAASTESYAGHTIYLIPSDTRTFRATLLDKNLLGASNAPTAEQIHALIDRASSTPWHGSSLLARRFPELPAFASAWAVGQVGLPFGEPVLTASKEPSQINAFGLQLPLPAGADYLVSVRYEGSVKVRMEEVDMAPGSPARTAGALYEMLGLVKSMKVLGKDQRTRQIIDSINIQEAPDRIALTASIPVETLAKAVGP